LLLFNKIQFKVSLAVPVVFLVVLAGLLLVGFETNFELLSQAAFPLAAIAWGSIFVIEALEQAKPGTARGKYLKQLNQWAPIQPFSEFKMIYEELWGVIAAIGSIPLLYGVWFFMAFWAWILTALFFNASGSR
jgi:hypothetical protein